ncbi:MAG: alpha/beta hydrolase [Kiritimatiellae bacterium]|nr:alpha/beta hydrolase [Kiritimatiellia bacterium]
MTKKTDGEHAANMWTDIPFAETPQRTLRLDLRVPRHAGKLPLVLYIPMSGMRSCEKAAAPWWLTDKGFAMASIECRVSSEVTAPMPVYDCKEAIRWLRAHADEYGYRSDAMGVWGHSAGGLLAALLGTSGGISELEGNGKNLNVSSRIQAVCDECGAPHDLAYFAQPAVKAKFAPVAENLRLYLGGPVEEKRQLARLVSPRTHLSPDNPPMLLIHGDADTIVPVEETIAFYEALRSIGVDATLRILPGIGHGWDSALTSGDVAAFFERTLMIPPKK